MAIGKFSCDHCGPCIVGHKPDCPVWEEDKKQRRATEYAAEMAVKAKEVMEQNYLAQLTKAKQLEQENAALKAHVARLREAAIEAKNWLSNFGDTLPELNEAIHATASSDDWLKERDAKVLEDAAIRYDNSAKIYGKLGYDVAGGLRSMASELRASASKQPEES
jgi:hypothetical protein